MANMNAKEGGILPLAFSWEIRILTPQTFIARSVRFPTCLALKFFPKPWGRWPVLDRQIYLQPQYADIAGHWKNVI